MLRLPLDMNNLGSVFTTLATEKVARMGYRARLVSIRGAEIAPHLSLPPVHCNSLPSAARGNYHGTMHPKAQA